MDQKGAEYSRVYSAYLQGMTIHGSSMGVMNNAVIDEEMKFMWCREVRGER